MTTKELIDNYINSQIKGIKSDLLNDMYKRYDTVGRYTVKKAIQEYAEYLGVKINK